MKNNIDMSPEAVAARERLAGEIAGRSKPAATEISSLLAADLFTRGGPRVFGVSPRPTQDPQERQRRQEEQQAIRFKKWEEKCPGRYRQKFDFSKVEPGVDHAKLRRILDWEYSDKGLYVGGTTGHSKSRAVYAMCGRIYMEGHDVEVIDGTRFANEAAAAWGDCQQTERWLKTLTEPAVLLIDDLAKKWTPSTEEAAFIVLDRRSAWCKPTHITLNYSGKDLREMAFDPAVIEPFLRRVNDYCEVIAV